MNTKPLSRMTPKDDLGPSSSVPQLLREGLPILLSLSKAGGFPVYPSDGGALVRTAADSSGADANANKAATYVTDTWQRTEQNK